MPRDAKSPEPSVAERDPAGFPRPDAHCLVVGIGNALRRDDGVGHVVVNAIAQRCPGIDTLVVHQVLPELAASLTGRRMVIFVDARIATDVVEAGVTIRRVRADWQGGGLDHVGNPAGTLALAEATTGSTPEAWIVTVPVTDIGLGTGLSPQTARLVPEAMAAIMAIADG
jgi:hydrogenase maturation protease